MSAKASGRKSRNDSPAPKPSAKGQARQVNAVAAAAAAAKPAEKKDSSLGACHYYIGLGLFIVIACFVTVSWEKRGLTVTFGEKMHLVVFRSPSETYTQEREFFLFDVCSLVLSASCLIHSLRCKGKSFTLYLSIFFGGALIDLTIRKIPQLASFWQGQNWMELLDYSEPAYILFGMYFVFQYPAIQLARGLKLDWMCEPAAAALLATMIYHPYDIVGAKYVWWLWHRDDPLMIPAELGVPVASTFWTMAYTGALSATFRYVTEHKRAEKMSSAMTAAWVAPIASLGLMNLPFCFYYQPLVLLGGVGELKVVNGFRAICLLLTLWGLLSRTLSGVKRQAIKANAIVLVVALVCFAALAGIVHYFDPAHVQRHGLFQTFGKCDTRESAYFGWKERSKFMCNETVGRNAELWDFGCVKTLPKAGSQWYTVCPKTFPEGWRETFQMHWGAGLVAVFSAFFLAAE